MRAFHHPGQALHAPLPSPRFLETAWEGREPLPDRGPEAWPDTFPDRSGRPEEAARPGCPAGGLVVQEGGYAIGGRIDAVLPGFGA